MQSEIAQKPSRQGSSFAELFTPKLVTVLREGYGLAQFRTDAVAGLTVAIVALPLSMAIAIAAGVPPVQGLYTAIIGGFLVSLLGGSRFQIAGPAGAFIVLMAGTVQAVGIDGLILATVLSGVMLTVIGFLRLGTYIKFIPHPVTVGFTAGIAIIIFASQIKQLLGLTLTAPEPGPLLEKIPVILESLPTFSAATVAIALGTIILIWAIKKLRQAWPGMLIAVAATTITAAALDLPVATIGSEFGAIPGGLPKLAWPTISFERVMEVMPFAVAFTLLGAIESLLSAVVADGMTGRRHRSNSELVAQGVANVGSGLFGGVCVTGNIARTATNVRAGAHGPVAGILHSAFLLLFILVAAPLASFIPLASLAGVLAVVAWNMIERDAIISLLRASRGETAVLLVTFLLTIFRDLTEAIVVGFALGSVLFIHRMSKVTEVETHVGYVPEDRADDADGVREAYLPGKVADSEVIVYRIRGTLFFGAAASVGSILDRIADRHRALVIDFADVSLVDTTAAHTIEGLANKARRRGVRLMLTSTTHDMRRVLFAQGIKPPLVSYESTIETGIRKIRHMLEAEDRTPPAA